MRTLTGKRDKLPQGRLPQVAELVKSSAKAAGQLTPVAWISIVAIIALGLAIYAIHAMLVVATKS